MKIGLRREYILARDKFDKALRNAERIHRNTLADDIETMSIKNPQKFWDKINKMGPRPNKSIPVETTELMGT